MPNTRRAVVRDLPLFQWATNTALTLPAQLSIEDWIECGKSLKKMETGVQWWIGDWWVFGEARKWGEGEEIAERIGWDYGYVRNLGWVANVYKDLSLRSDKLSFAHHQEATAESVPQKRRQWLERAEHEHWSVSQLKTAIARQAALDKCSAIDLDATKVGKIAVLYGDPPWRYEHPPMGGSNRSIENHYPTMDLAEICSLPVGDVAHENSVLFLWATSPKLPECLEVIRAWGFTYRTDMVWKIGRAHV